MKCFKKQTNQGMVVRIFWSHTERQKGKKQTVYKILHGFKYYLDLSLLLFLNVSFLHLFLIR